MLALDTEGDAVLIFDDPGFAKQGRASAGVQRQYSRTLGKTGNCQVAVSCHYAERTTAWPVDVRLYMPKAWMADAERCRRAHVPEGTHFRTKAEIALDLLDEAKMLAVPLACVKADAGYGDNPLFLNGLEVRDERYVVAVCEDFTIALSRSGGASDSGEKAEAVLRRAVPRGVWQTIRWAEGRRDTLRAKAVALRCWRIDGDGTRHVGWLIGQRSARGRRGPRDDPKYFWSNFPPQTSLERMLEYAHRRHWIEQYYEEAKTLLGWDQFQGRRHDAFHRHAVTVSLSYSFLIWLEWRVRQRTRRRGRQRRVFSPSERSRAAHPASDLPLDCRLATSSRSPHIDSCATTAPQLSAPTLTKQY